MSNESLIFETPMMQQYMQLKEKYSDCILLFRLGDFYEMFLEDAKLGAKILDITLTARDRGKDGKIPMAGVPFHALDSYLYKLVKAGHKVAICEQLSDPSVSKLVERDVVRIVTPGTLLDENSLDKKENNYLLGLHIEKGKLGVGLVDLSTGIFQVTEYSGKEVDQFLLSELSKYKIAECVLPNSAYNDPGVLKKLKNHKNLNIFPYSDWEMIVESSAKVLEDHFGASRLINFGLEGLDVAKKAAAGLLSYLKYTQKDKVSHLQKITLLEEDRHLLLDRSTIINLELFSTIRDNKRRGSLLDVLDYTVSPMGGRLLRQYMLKPLKDRDLLEARYNVVEEFLHKSQQREELSKLLSQIFDLERILAKLSTGVGSPKDLINLKSSLETVKRIKKLLPEFSSSLLQTIQNRISDSCLNLADYLHLYIADDPPFDPRTGGLIKEGVDTHLDELRSIVQNSQEFVAKLELTEREKTGIGSLKVKYNQVFGYYIEITKANLDFVPNHYQRRQTLVNAERFITPELKEHEEIILKAQEEILELEYQTYLSVVKHVISHIVELQETSQALAELDVLQSFCQVSIENNYTRPIIVDEVGVHIMSGRHPIVEKIIEESDFIPNDTQLSPQERQLLVITGPNMAGKSVYIRQVALIVIMAQIGCFVPASKVELSIMDKVFVRSGASDVISMGLSTFMVEMLETSYILNNATSRSLIIMDEIGRGTSTYDGISIAWSVAESLVKNPNLSPLTLFATHYHELQSLAEKYPEKIKNYQVEIYESGGEPVFLHKIKPGGANSSFGIAVAKMAGVPQEVCDSASQILNGLKSKQQTLEVLSSTLEANNVKSSLVHKLKGLDLTTTTPLAALNILAELKKITDGQN